MTIPDDSLPKFTPLINLAGLEAAHEDECVEDTYFRLIIESEFFDTLDPDDRELFLLAIAQSCIQWVLDRKVY